MVARVGTVAFQGIEAVPVDVQVMVAPGKMGMSIVGLPDKAVAESRERVQAALHASGLSMPTKRVTVNLAPADLPKEGSHYDLPIAVGLMAAIGAIPADAIQSYLVLGELSLDGSITAVAGVLPAAIGANREEKGLICPHACGPEAAWAGANIDILAPRSLIALANHFRGTQVLTPPDPSMRVSSENLLDLADIKGQETAKRALEIAAAGNHNLLLVGPPGSGKSMLAQRLPSILPRLSPRELLDVSMIASIAGELAGGKLSDRRPFRSPHHSASMAAMVGGGLRARPGEVSLAHNGVLFLDEFPEFSPQVLDSLRQPLETGECLIARVNHRTSYSARFQLIAAMNPCRCGMAGEPGHTCARGPRCQTDYQARISGPLLDRIDLRVDMPAISQRNRGATGGPCQGRSGCPLRGAGFRSVDDECSLFGKTDRGRCTTGCSGIEAVARCERADALFRARLSSHPESCPHAGRSRRRGSGQPHSFGWRNFLSHRCGTVDFCGVIAHAAENPSLALNCR
jgi:magnesium chelatase family protein